MSWRSFDFTEMHQRNTSYPIFFVAELYWVPHTSIPSGFHLVGSERQYGEYDKAGRYTNGDGVTIPGRSNELHGCWVAYQGFPHIAVNPCEVKKITEAGFYQRHHFT